MNVDFDSVSCKPYRYELVSQKDDRLEWRKFGGSVLFIYFAPVILLRCHFFASMFPIYVSQWFQLWFLLCYIFLFCPFSFNFHRPNEGLETYAGPAWSCSKCSNCRKKTKRGTCASKNNKGQTGSKLVPSLLFGSQHSSQFRFPMISSYLMLYVIASMVLANSSDPRIPGYPPSRNRTSDASEKKWDTMTFLGETFRLCIFCLGTNRSHLK